jgi:hypothetical protein
MTARCRPTRDRLSLLVRYLNRFNAGSDDRTGLLPLLYHLILLSCAMDRWPLFTSQDFSLRVSCCVALIQELCCAVPASFMTGSYLPIWTPRQRLPCSALFSALRTLVEFLYIIITGQMYIVYRNENRKPETGNQTQGER